MKRGGYQFDVPAMSMPRSGIVVGNAARSAPSNVHVESAWRHVRGEKWLRKIERNGDARRKHKATAVRISCSATFWDVCCRIQPAFGYEGDPMRLLSKGLHPTQPSRAFYVAARKLGADAVLHFGPWRARFMPGKHGLSARVAGRLIGVCRTLLYARQSVRGHIASAGRSDLISYYPAVRHWPVSTRGWSSEASITRCASFADDARNRRPRDPIGPGGALELAQTDRPGVPGCAIGSFPKPARLEYTLIPPGFTGRRAVCEQRVEIVQAVADARWRASGEPCWRRSSTAMRGEKAAADDAGAAFQGVGRHRPAGCKARKSGDPARA